MKDRGILRYLPGVVLILLAFGFVRLFQVRFEQGDIYPPYSSLRSDPLGTRILAESLASLENTEVLQNTVALHDAEWPETATLIRLGVDAENVWLPNREADALQSFVRSGGRLILAMLPVASTEPEEDPAEDEVCEHCGKVHNPSKKESKKKQSSEAPGKDGEDPEKEEPEEEDSDRNLRRTDLFARWGVEPGSVLKKDTTPQDRLAGRTSPWDLPYDSWLKLQPNHDAWRVLYTYGSEPVVIERDYGRGSIVLVGTSYPFSNEALLYPSHLPSLLTFFGDASTVVFDESHFGIRRQSGLMDLIYAYGLQGVLFTLGFIALLYLWRSLMPLIPPYSDEKIDLDYGKGRFDAAAGLTRLMRRHLPIQHTPSALLELHRQATRSQTPQRRVHSTLSRMQALTEEPGRTDKKNVLSTVQQLHRIANEKPGG